ncbi:MAG: methyltransferase domain-containing protein [Rhodopseudomonas sp.]|nr:methyltransferase domain-containing protein [Rhodopseudomonas sp.]
MTATAAAVAMDRMYRRQRHIYDLTRKFYLLGRDRLIAGLNAAPSDAILEIGCGTGRNLVALAACYPASRLYGLDVSAEMLVSASNAVARAGLADRVVLKQADAVTFDPDAVLGRARFERIVISYCLSMIPPWQSVAAAAIDLLPPGGELHIVDFGGQEGLPAWFRSVLRSWLKLFHVTPRDDMEAVLHDLAQNRGMNLSLTRPYFGYSQLAIIRRP